MSDVRQRNRLAYTTDPYMHALVSLVSEVAAGQDEAWERFEHEATYRMNYERRRSLLTRLLVELPVLVELGDVLRVSPDAFASREAVRALQAALRDADALPPHDADKRIEALASPPTEGAGEP